MRIFDSLTNLVSGLGVFGKDKAAHGTFVLEVLQRQELDAMYRGDWAAGKIVDIPAFDMTRAWRSWQADPKQITAIEKEEKRLGLRRKIKKAITMARLYGGAAIMLDDGAKSPEQLLQPLKVTGRGGLKQIMVVSRYKLTPGENQDDPLQPGYDEPKEWQLNGGASRTIVRLHPSRVVTFTGNDILEPEVAMGPGDRVWGDSVLQRVLDAVRNAAATDQAIASLLQEAKVDVIRVPNLMSQVGTKEYRDRFVAKAELAATLKSINNILLLDMAEEYTQKQVRLQGLPDVQKGFLEVVCAAADIPAVRFLNQSPKGLGNGGDAEMHTHADRINAEQKLELDPRLDRIDPFLLISALGTAPDTISYDWNPLWALSEVDKATIEKGRADAVKIIADSGMVPRAALQKGFQNRLIEDGTYPGLEKLIKEAEAGTLKPWVDEGYEGSDPDAKTAANENTPEGAAAAAGGKPGAKKPGAGGNTHEVSVAGPGGLTIKAKVKSRDSASVRDAAPKPLYVRRDLVNYRDILAWARDEGLPNVVPGTSMHVTLAYSKAPVDWMKIGSTWNSDPQGRLRIPPGGPRVIERLGATGKAVVLSFRSEDLNWEHQMIHGNGEATWDHEDYQPHLTLSWDVPADFDLEAVTPYQGRLVLGPQIFEEIVEDWVEKNQGGS